MVDYNLIINFLVAIALGALIGLEREFAQAKRKIRWYGGIRTFPLIALLGALAGFFGENYSIWITVIAFAAVVILIFISHKKTVSKFEGIGITTEIAGLITFLIGALSYYGFLLLAVILAVLMTLLLYQQYPLHRFAQKIKKEELYSTIKFAIIAFVILPVLPNRPFGPFDFFNPYSVWLIVVLVSGVSFLGYLLVKWIGTKGIELAGFLGGFASSTAATLSLIQESKKTKGQSVFIIGIVAANAAMMLKILILIFILNKDIFSQVVLPVALMAAMSGIFVGVLYRHAHLKKHKIKLESPFTIGPALKFGAVFVVILFVVKALAFTFSARGLYISTFISGLFDADATALSAIQLDGLSLNILSAGVVIGIIANTLSKGIMAFLFGRRSLAYRLSLILIVVAAVGVAVLFLF